MGVSRDVYFGVYMVVELKKIQKTKGVFGCEDHKDENYGGYYCPECGKKRTTWSEIELVYPNIYDMFVELDIKEDTFCVARDDAEDGSSEILIQNTGEGVIYGTKPLQLEILPDMPDLSIKKFNDDYKSEIQKINSASEYVKSCTVKFGIVQYFN